MRVEDRMITFDSKKIKNVQIKLDEEKAMKQLKTKIALKTRSFIYIDFAIWHCVYQMTNIWEVRTLRLS